MGVASAAPLVFAGAFVSSSFCSLLLAELSLSLSLALASESEPDSDSDSGSGVGSFLDFLDFFFSSASIPLLVAADLAMSLLFDLGVWEGLATRPSWTLANSAFFASFFESLAASPPLLAFFVFDIVEDKVLVLLCISMR